jgi:hypothetical protein
MGEQSHMKEHVPWTFLQRLVTLLSTFTEQTCWVKVFINVLMSTHKKLSQSKDKSNYITKTVHVCDSNNTATSAPHVLSSVIWNTAWYCHHTRNFWTDIRINVKLSQFFKMEIWFNNYFICSNKYGVPFINIHNQRSKIKILSIFRIAQHLSITNVPRVCTQ